MKIKIVGNLTPEVGVSEKYTVEKVKEAFDTKPVTIVPEQPDSEIKWNIYVKDAKVWRLANVKEKKGQSVTYKFSEISSKAKDVAMIVEAYGKETLIHIKPQPTSNPKITSIELLNVLKKIPTRKFAYGDSIIARVHCVGMELLPIVVTLWENDGDKQKLKTTNLKIDTQKKFVRRGFADVKFYLNPMHVNLANSKVDKGESDEGKYHEYYVTAEILGKEESRKATLDTHVANPDYVEKKLIVKNEIATKPVMEVINSKMMVDLSNSQSWWPFKEDNCGGKYCIKKGDKNELIREINIRLAGFGGNVPTDEFTERTERMIKQFQRDYMKVPETGKICGNVLNAIDEFQRKYPINFDEIKCQCGTCNGYGKGRSHDQYQNSSILEAYRKYEYPGIHRSLVCAYRASVFYINKDKQLNYKTKHIESGYRCHDHYIYRRDHTTNHCGKALDIHYNFLDTNMRASNIRNMNEIRKNIFMKYLGAKQDWNSGKDIFYLESWASTWVHLDVREFSQKYLTEDYFITNNKDLDGKQIVQLAKELQFSNTCLCTGLIANVDNSMDGRVHPSSLTTSSRGIDFIKNWESFKSNLYNDDANGHHCTIGYGHLVHRGPCNGSEPQEFKDGISKERALELFNFRLVEFENAIKRDITVNLHQYEFDALVSLVFNAGANFLNEGGINDGETKIKIKINNSDYSGGADEFSDVTNGGLSGLVKRRKAEIDMFKNNNYNSTH
ncbi:glycoside hydrolase family protein [Flavobacterium hercynium]|uniref:Lysozyme n=1 Tax=Flavobacterium hercynium TaxID=387094 RepID=A0A226GQT8_9FLAO|nr:glycoside hydrolase family protein [Flavobacterium hercynium]OXA83898.1 hypothetical protein B0A66_21750 [Flavobacterium hercynium]SMP37328.1 Phage-related lysozyme (muramidase), GH24 family [Flavobacterium hercynium]